MKPRLALQLTRKHTLKLLFLAGQNYGTLKATGTPTEETTKIQKTTKKIWIELLLFP